MLKFVWILLLFQSAIFSIDIDTKTKLYKLLPYSEIYIDYNRSRDIAYIKKQPFKKENRELRGFGYSPNFDVWVRFTLTNKTDHIVNKILEYDNPLTSFVDFFEDGKLVKQDGLLNISKDRDTLNPILKITLQPHQSKEFYIKASSKITTLIVKLNLWSTKAFEKKERNREIILAMFFGAMFIMILYNSTISILTREKGYIYYVLFAISVSFHHFIYIGAINLYFSSQLMNILIDYFSVIVALPTIFLVLYTKHILSLKKNYPKLNRALNIAIGLYILAIFTIYITGLYQYRSLAFIALLSFMFFIVCYALFKKDREAYYIIWGWILFMMSGLLMYLSSLGTYDIFKSYPYIVESSLILEIVAFSVILGIKIDTLNREKIIFKEKELSYIESEHRFKNTIQIILSFITFQRDKINDKKTDLILSNLENRIMATSHLHSLLQTEDTNKYFSSILNDIQDSFKQENIQIETHCDKIYLQNMQNIVVELYMRLLQMHINMLLMV